MLALYKNIKARRLELKMSQDRLAELTGYKDRSSIAKIEKVKSIWQSQKSVSLQRH